MKTRPLTLLSALVTCAVLTFSGLAGCQSSGGAPPAKKTNFKYGTGDGQTMASAVEIRTRSETDGGILIRGWIKSNYPGYAISEQELIEQRDKAYNMITIVGPSNSMQRVYFDITQFYRRLNTDPFPKPM